MRENRQLVSSLVIFVLLRLSLFTSGFRVQIHDCKPESVVNMQGMTGKIQTPGYPGQYPPNVVCHWNISVPDGYLVRLYMRRLEISSLLRDCSEALFDSRDGPTSTSPRLMWRCGTWNELTSYSSGPHLWVIFKSDSTVSKGFEAEYTAIPSDQACSVPNVSTIEVQVNKTALLRTPFYPAKYPPKQNCTWIFVAPPGYRVEFGFTRAMLEFKFDCIGGDTLVIRDGNTSSSTLLRKLCGNAPRCPLYSSSRYLWAQFLSNDDLTFDGVEAVIRAVPEEEIRGLNGPVTNESGEEGFIRFTNSFTEVAILPFCVWQITVPPDKVVKLTLDVSVTLLKPRCAGGQVHVYNGSGTDGAKLGTLCGGPQNRHKPVFTSTGNQMVFWVEPSSMGYIFDVSANFKAIKNEGCSPNTVVNRTTNGGTVASPYHPVFYPINQICTWLITAPEGHVIGFRYNSLNLGLGDSLTLRDGPNSKGTVMSVDVQHSPAVFTSCRHLWIRFFSDGAITQAGYNVSYWFVKVIKTRPAALFTSQAPSPTTTPLVGHVTKHVTLQYSTAQPSIVLPLGVGVGVAVFLVAIVVAACLVIRRTRKHKNELITLVDVTPCDQWEIGSNQLRLLDELGHGAFGKVWRGELEDELLKSTRFAWTQKQDGSSGFVAVKMLHNDAGDEERKEFLNEIKLMKSVGRHSNIISMVACCTQVEPFFLVVEYACYGDLLNYLRKIRAKIQTKVHEGSKTTGIPVYTNRDAFTDTTGSHECMPPPKKTDEEPVPRSDDASEDIYKDLASFTWQISRGMEYLCSKGFVHRDLAARNVLVAEGPVLKVADFGLTRHVTYEQNVYRSHGQRKLPIKWMSPEAIYDQIFTSKTDVWSFGVLLWEIYTLGGTPYPTITNRQLFNSLRDGLRLERPDLCPEEMYTILTHCWETDPDRRPTFSQLREEIEAFMTIANPYVDFTGIDEAKDYYLKPSFYSDQSSDESEVSL